MLTRESLNDRIPITNRERTAKQSHDPVGEGVYPYVNSSTFGRLLFCQSRDITTERSIISKNKYLNWSIRLHATQPRFEHITKISKPKEGSCGLTTASSPTYYFNSKPSVADYSKLLLAGRLP